MEVITETPHNINKKNSQVRRVKTIVEVVKPLCSKENFGRILLGK